MDNSYLEKISLLTEYNPCKTYNRGDVVIHNAKVYKNIKNVKTPEPWDETKWKETDYESYVGKKKDSILHFENIIVKPEHWKKWTPKNGEKDTHKSYPYTARFRCEGVTAKTIPYVFFSTAEAQSGLYAPIATTGKNVIYIYAKKIPAEKICIPFVKCVEET